MDRDEILAIHRANTGIEMPASVFVAAVTRAQEDDFGKDAGHLKPGVGMAALEKHPALKMLTDWWNENAPDPATRCAGMAMPQVACGHGDGWRYSYGYYETPSVEFKRYEEWEKVTARVGNYTLVEFVKSQHDLDPSEGEGTPIFRDVAGNHWFDVGVLNEEIYSGEYDEAWYSLEALKDFPERFPCTWTHLLRQAARECKAKPAPTVGIVLRLRAAVRGFFPAFLRPQNTENP